MNAGQILSVCRLVDAVRETKPLGQCNPHVCFQARQNDLWARNAVGNHAVIVVAILFGEQPVRCDGIPERRVVQRDKPVRYVFDVFKDHHADSVPNQTAVQQT